MVVVDGRDGYGVYSLMLVKMDGMGLGLAPPYGNGYWAICMLA